MLIMELAEETFFKHQNDLKMTHSISVKKITNLFNPYEIIPEGLSLPITIKDVDAAIKNINSIGENSRDIQIQRIAELVLNPEIEPIHIDIGNPETGNSPNNLLKNGFNRLAAAIYRKDTNILVDLEGSNKALEALFGITNQKNNHFDWSVSSYSLSSTWSDKDFVLKQILKGDNNVIKLADPEIWTTSFLSELLSSYKGEQLIKQISKTQPDILFTENLIKAIAENVKVFKVIWDDHFQYLFENDEYKSSPISNIEKQSELKKIINKELFSNTFFCSELLKESLDFYKYLPKEMQLNSQITNTIYELNKNKESWEIFNFGNFVPVEYFDDFNANINFMNIFYKTGSTSNSNYFDAATKNWIKDKEKCIKMFQSFANTDYIQCEIYSSLDSTLHKDKDFNLKILNSNPGLYNLLSSKLKNDIDIIYTTCKSENLSDLHFPEIPQKSLSLIKDEEVIKRISYQNPSLLEKQSIPDGWIVTKELLISLKDRIIKLNIKKISNYKEFFNDENFISSLIENNNKFYYSIPKKDKNNKFYALKYLDFHENKHTTEHKYYFKNLSHELWLDKKFCIDAFKIDQYSLNHIPKQFFNQKDFILDFFKEVTDKNSSFVREKLPKEINHYLTVFNVDSEYHDFFNKVVFNQSLDYNLTTKDKPTRNIKI